MLENHVKHLLPGCIAGASAGTETRMLSFAFPFEAWEMAPVSYFYTVSQGFIFPFYVNILLFSQTLTHQWAAEIGLHSAGPSLPISVTYLPNNSR